MAASIASSKASLLFDFSHSRQAILSVAQPGLAALLALGGFPSLRVVGLGLVASTAGMLCVYASNDLLDLRVDREAVRSSTSPKIAEGYDIDVVAVRHPVAMGVLSLRLAVAWVVVLGLIALGFAYWLRPGCALIFAGCVCLEVVYCALKRRTWLKTVPAGAMVGLGALAGWYAVRDFDLCAVAFFFLLAFWEIFGRNLTNDLADRSHDAPLGIKTLATVHGPKWCGPSDLGWNHRYPSARCPAARQSLPPAAPGGGGNLDDHAPRAQSCPVTSGKGVPAHVQSGQPVSPACLCRGARLLRHTERPMKTLGRLRGKSRSPERDIRTPTDATYLRDLFNNSARYYESVNMVTSAGQVVLWRREVVAAAHLKPTDRVLDAFCGPGGLAERALPLLGNEGRLVLADLSPVMLHEARLRLARRSAGRTGPRPNIEFIAGDLLSEDLGLGDFDVVFLGWGLRYVADVGAALARMRSFLRPEGRLVVLEFTRPAPLSWATPAHYYFRHVLPRVGSWLARDRELHDYLKVSAAEFLSATELRQAVERTGFEVVSCRSHLGGLVTILAATAT